MPQTPSPNTHGVGSVDLMKEAGETSKSIIRSFG